MVVYVYAYVYEGVKSGKWKGAGGRWKDIVNVNVKVNGDFGGG